MSYTQLQVQQTLPVTILDVPTVSSHAPFAGDKLIIQLPPPGKHLNSAVLSTFSRMASRSASLSKFRRDVFFDIRGGASLTRNLVRNRKKKPSAVYLERQAPVVRLVSMSRWTLPEELELLLPQVALEELLV